MHETVLSIVAIVVFCGTLGYILFSKPKSKAEKDSPVFNASVTWGGSDEKEVFENYKKATFKGEHRHY